MLENRHDDVTTNYFKHTLMGTGFVDQKKNLKNPTDFEAVIKRVKNCDTHSMNRYHEEWKEKLSKEKSVFTGKVEIDKNEGETASTVS